MCSSAISPIVRGSRPSNRESRSCLAPRGGTKLTPLAKSAPVRDLYQSFGMNIFAMSRSSIPPQSYLCVAIDTVNVNKNPMDWDRLLNFEFRLVDRCAVSPTPRKIHYVDNVALSTEHYRTYARMSSLVVNFAKDSCEGTVGKILWDNTTKSPGSGSFCSKYKFTDLTTYEKPTMQCNQRVESVLTDSNGNSPKGENHAYLVEGKSTRNVFYLPFWVRCALQFNR